MTPSHEDRLRALSEILQTVRWMVGAGFLPTTTNRIAREALHFIWERRLYPQWDLARPHSASARARRALFKFKKEAKLRYDHAFPLKLLWPKLLPIADDIEKIEPVLAQFLQPVIITKDEDDTLKMAGLADRMPEDWDQVDILARYKAVGIEFQQSDLDAISKLM